MGVEMIVERWDERVDMYVDVDVEMEMEMDMMQTQKSKTNMKRTTIIEEKMKSQ